MNMETGIRVKVSKVSPGLGTVDHPGRVVQFINVDGWVVAVVVYDDGAFDQVGLSALTEDKDEGKDEILSWPI